MVFAAAWHHEPWADEAQAWLLARDSSLWELWGRLLHYEGTPGLWHSLLHALIALGLPYRAFNYFSGSLGTLAAWLVIRYSPFPLPVRLLLPFTFFLGYQYAVVARSYDLVPLLLFGIAIFFQRVWLPAALLCLLAATSVHALILSACIAVALLVKHGARTVARPAVLYAVVVAAVVAAAYPAHDVAFVTHSHASLRDGILFTRETVRDAFTGEGYSTALALALSAAFLWRGRGLLLFVSSTLLLCAFGTLVYAHVWHQGIIFLAWLFALWISTGATGMTKPAFAALAMVIVCHCYWTVQSVRYDWTHAYSAGRATARFLESAHIPTGSVYAVGYASTAVKPYFPRGMFAGGPAYWDWSVRNRANDPRALLESPQREYVAAGYKDQLEKRLWADVLLPRGYTQVKNLEGALFWHDHPLEPESCDVYRRTPGAPVISLSSEIQMGNGEYAPQLIEGFYGSEGNSWRWTAKAFSMELKPPEGSAAGGAVFRLRLFFPGEHIAALGPVALHAEIGGVSLASQTFTQGGTSLYSAVIPAALLRGESVRVSVELDKASASSPADSRVLGVIVTSAGLYPK